MKLIFTFILKLYVLKNYSNFSPFQTKIIDAENRVVPVNVPGEICFRGHGIMLGYWDDKAKTDEVIDDSGWFHSG